MALHTALMQVKHPNLPSERNKSSFVKRCQNTNQCLRIIYFNLIEFHAKINLMIRIEITNKESMLSSLKL